MRRNILLLCTFLLILSACTSQKPPQDAPTAANPPTEPANPLPAEMPAPPNPSERQGVLTEVLDQVQSSPQANVPLKDAVPGEVLLVGGQAITGDPGKARIDLMPEDTVVRMGPNTAFEVTQLTPSDQGILTRLRLLGGKIWVWLAGGELEVETTSGTAGVRGSLLSVSFLPDSGAIEITCLEGHCDLSNQAGTTVLEGGQVAVIPGPGQPPSEPMPMSEQQMQDWQENNPDLNNWIDQQAISLPPEGGYPPPLPPGGEPEIPFMVDIHSNCAQNTFTITLSGPVTKTYHAPPGTDIHEELPPGEYTITETVHTDYDGKDLAAPPYQMQGGYQFFCGEQP